MRKFSKTFGECESDKAGLARSRARRLPSAIRFATRLGAFFGQRDFAICGPDGLFDSGGRRQKHQRREQSDERQSGPRDRQPDFREAGSGKPDKFGRGIS